MGKPSRDKGKRCACGCGTPIPALTTVGKPQRFVHGHNARGLSYEVEDRGYSSPCWIFSNGGDRYGRIRRNGHHYQAHRFVYEQEVGPIAAGLTLDHLCGIKNCVNPEHLEPVTLAENIRRAQRLSADDVAEIRAEGERLLVGRSQRRPLGSRQALARRYGVDVKTIRNIWSGHTWAP